MRFTDLMPRATATQLTEGGWSSTVTQKTNITPAVVKTALARVQQFTDAFNKWLAANGHSSVSMGRPLGSTAWHEVDAENNVYGDIDLQMIAEPLPEAKTPSQFAAHWNKLVDTFIAETKPGYVYDQGQASGGHVVFQINTEDYVQVDLLWTESRLANWMRYRMTPAHKVKGAMYGNLFSTLGEIMNISIQSAGAQMKIKDGQPAEFGRTRKYDTLETLTTDIHTFGLDLLKQLYTRMFPDKDVNKIKVDPQLAAIPGIDPNEITAANLVTMIKGLAKSFEANNMFGRYNLRDINDYADFIEKFKAHYNGKLNDAVNATKFDKAETPEAKARAADVKNKLISHGAAIMGLF